MQATEVAQVRHSFFSPPGAKVALSELAFSIVVIAVLIPLTSEAATYYTKKTGNDGNSCAAAQNEGTPKLTINGGKNCLTSPGDTLVVGDGTYVEGHINMTVSGTQANPITIRAQNRHLAILSSISGSSGCQPNISFNASWLVIDGLRGQINDADPSCSNNSANGAFVRMWGTTTPTIGGSQTTGNQGGTVRNCMVDDHNNRSVGIKTNQDNSLVENCIMHHSLEAFNGINQVFRNNIIDGQDAWGDYFTAKGGARNTQFYNNVIYRNSGWRGLVLGGNSSCCHWDTSTKYECYNCVGYNNVVIVQSGSAANAVSLTGCDECTLSNNVIIGATITYNTGGDAGAGGAQPYPRNPTLLNNITYCNGMAAQTGSFTGTQTRDYNNYYDCSGTPSQVHPIIGNPQFVNLQSDWHLNSGSPAIGSGVEVAVAAYAGGAINVSQDKVGITRTTPWSLGIYARAGTTSDVPPAPPTGLRIQ